MKKLLSICLISLTFCAAGFAKTTTTKSQSSSKSSFDIRKPVKAWIKDLNDGFRFGISSGTMDTNVRARRAGFDESAKDDSSTFQLQVGHEKILNRSLGHSAFAIYQNGGFEGESSRHMRLSGNATYGINNQIYTFAGLNFGKFYGSGTIEDKFDAGFGYQAGVGFKFHKRANIEIEHLVLNSEGRDGKLNLDLQSKGIMLKINTPFSFNI